MTDPRPQGLDQALATLPAQVRAHLETLRDALKRELGDDLVALIVFGSLARGDYRSGKSDVDIMVVLRDDTREKLERIGHALLVARYAARIEAIIMRADEIATAADVFPLLYDDARECNVVLYGTNPFEHLKISDKHRRLRIEQELREARIRVRRMVTDGDRSPATLAGAVERKLRQVRGPLRALLRLRGDEVGVSLEDVTRQACKVWKADAATLLHAQEKPAAAYDELAKLLAAAIEDADRRDEAGDPNKTLQ